MKVFFHSGREQWITDRFKSEWDADNADISTQNLRAADVIWINADWAWDQIPQHLFIDRKVLVTCHHYVPDKFIPHDFRERDQFVTAYHVPNQHTFDFIRPFTQKRIELIPYWANQNIWRSTLTKHEARAKHSVRQDAFVIGSFQRDTEGAGISRGEFYPKLEKGADLLADFIVSQAHRNPYVLLGAFRRQYLLGRLKEARVSFSYHEMPSQEQLTELYSCCDLYPVTSRFEGGPQALIECGLLGVPVVSRDVGMASQVLPPEAINDDVSKATPHVPNVEHLRLPGGYELYRKLLASL